MWSAISAISSIITCITFLLYLIGRIWVVSKNISTIYEKFSIFPFDSSHSIEDEDNLLLVDNNGSEFSLQSNYGIKTVKVFAVEYELNQEGHLNEISKKLKAAYRDLGTNTLFIKCDLGEVFPITQFEIERSDYINITFDVVASGKNGHIVACNYKNKLTLKGLIFHLCV